jgi:hypothetical protein
MKELSGVIEEILEKDVTRKTNTTIRGTGTL